MSILNDGLDSSLKQNSKSLHYTFHPVAYKGNREMKYFEERFSLQMATHVIRDLECMKG